MALKSVSDIRGVNHMVTHSGRAHSAALPHITYLKLSCLEKEKARIEKEKQSAAARIRSIDERIEGIEAEKAVLLARLENKEANGAGRYGTGSCGRSHALCSPTSGFKIRY